MEENGFLLPQVSLPLQASLTIEALLQPQSILPLSVSVSFSGATCLRVAAINRKKNQCCHRVNYVLPLAEPIQSTPSTANPFRQPFTLHQSH